MKRLIWTVLVSTVMAASAGLAARLLDGIWRRVAKGPPPEMPGWARFLLRAPLRKQIEHRVHGAHV